MRGLPAVLLLLAGACATAPADPFDNGNRALDRGDLIGALQDFDRVPPKHRHYGEARVLVRAVERRIRRSQELVLRGLDHRAQWRDEEAVRLFRTALQIWPQIHEAEGLLLATRSRMQVLDPPLESSPEVGDEHTLDLDGGARIPAAPPGGEGRRPVEAGAPDPLHRPIRRIGELLAAGRLDPAIEAAEQLHDEHPDHARVGWLLRRALHHRALLRYGQGYLEEALADWTVLLERFPDDRQARAFHLAARAERATRGARR